MPRRGGRDGGSGGGGGGGSGHRGPQSREVTVSKKLSWLLRHGAKKEGVSMHAGGWVSVADVLGWRDVRNQQVDFAELKELVRTNGKQRYQLVPMSSVTGKDGAKGKDVKVKDGEQLGDPEATQQLATTTTTTTADEPAATNLLTLDPASPDDPAKHLIRATQGHSLEGVQAEELLTMVTADDIPAKCLPLVVHGTTPKAWELIQKSEGLKKMGRTHVHFAARVPDGGGGVISGMRASATILIWVDVQKSMAAGIKWWLSANGVILTEGNEKGLLPLEYVSLVERREKGSKTQQIWPKE